MCTVRSVVNPSVWRYLNFFSELCEDCVPGYLNLSLKVLEELKIEIFLKKNCWIVIKLPKIFHKF
jgi:hypothetical protein